MKTIHPRRGRSRKTELRSAAAAPEAPAAAAPNAPVQPPRLEKRAYEGAAVEVRAGAGGKTELRGLIPYNSQSLPMWGMVEEVKPGAFANSLRSGDIRALWQHDDSLVLGRSSAGTLRFEDSAAGLAYIVTPPDAQWARDAVESIRRGDVSQSSFRFRTITDRWSTRDGMDFRELVEVELLEVSPVTFPAYPASQAGLRSLSLAGLDAAAVCRAADKAKSGQPLSGEERALLRQAINALAELAGPEAPPPPAAEQGRNANRRRRLDLALAMNRP